MKRHPLGGPTGDFQPQPSQGASEGAAALDQRPEREEGTQNRRVCLTAPMISMATLHRETRALTEPDSTSTLSGGDGGSAAGESIQKT
jgi:hypothetical protein